MHVTATRMLAIVNKSENVCEDNLHKLVAKSTLTNVTDMSKNIWKWNIADICNWFRSYSKILHFKYHDIRKLYHIISPSFSQLIMIYIHILYIIHHYLLHIRSYDRLLH